MRYTATELAELSNVVALERERRSLTSLHAFTRYFWPVVEPKHEFIDGWHIDAICEHLEAVARGEILDLIINMPPRHMKSLLVAVMFFCWRWSLEPSEQFVYSSYSGALSMRDSLKCRRLITHPRFTRLFGSTCRLAKDQGGKVRFENTALGMRLATSVGGVTTGEGGDYIIVDDPVSAMDAFSDPVRESANTWWSEAMSTRGNTKTSARILVMQRLHEKDLTGHWKSEEPGITHLVLPAEYEVGKGVQTKLKGRTWRDPRSKKGELLWPARFGAPELAKLKRALGSYGTAGQLQQRPSPEGGGILKTADIRLWRSDKPLPDFTFLVQSYDTAYTEDTMNDPCACSVWGVFEYAGVNNILLMDYWTDWMEYPKLRKKMIKDYKAEYGGWIDDKTGGFHQLHPPRKADVVLIEEKSSGISLIQDLRLARVPVHPYNPGKADKPNRAHQAAPFLEAGVVWVLESTVLERKGKPRDWAQPLLDQCESFPNGEHDDGVDTLTQAIIYFRDAKFLELEAVPLEEVTERDYYGEAKRKRNPYGD